MKPHIDKIHNIQIYANSDSVEIIFMLKQYKGMKFDLNFNKNGIPSTYGWQACDVLVDGIVCELTNRQRNNCGKYIEKNMYILGKYFREECEETKLPLLLLTGE